MVKEKQVPRRVEDLTADFLSGVAGKMLDDPSVRVTGFQVVPDPFEFPRFGDKRFYEIAFAYDSAGGPGRSTLILRVLPKWDAVMAITGDTQHRELQAFLHGIYGQIPPTFYVPYIDVIYAPEREQYWAFVEDVREDTARLGMTEALSDETLRTILSHLAAFHAAFWERRDVLDLPWLMRLERPVDYFYRCVVDILDGMKEPAEVSSYIAEKWPWFVEGVHNLIGSLPPKTRRAVDALYRNPQRLLEKVEPLPLTLCHYDFDNRNLGLRETPDGPKTVVFDWEIMGEGLSSADVGRFLAYQQPPNAEELIGVYLDELQRDLGRAIDVEQWLYGFELVTVAIWQIIGVLFAAMVNSPSSPIPDDQREGMRARVYSDIGHVVALVEKYGLAT
ncbi:MAG: phosphotransferase [Chloroflexi bacterium]|nr:phosphotransferase [Chloroflexota bacterium]